MKWRKSYSNRRYDPTDEFNQLRNLHEGKTTFNDLSCKLGTTSTRLMSNVLNDLMGKYSYSSKIMTRLQAIEMLNSGMTPMETAKRLSVTPQSVYKWRKIAKTEGIDILCQNSFR